MTLQLTERERQVFSRVGYKYAVDDFQRPVTVQEVADAVMRVMEEPEARAMEASVLALVELAETNALGSLYLSAPVALRRLGYVAERLSAHEMLSAEVQKRFQRFASRLRPMVAQDAKKPLFLTDSVTPGRARRLCREADSVNNRWLVFGDVCLRVDLAW